MGISSVVASLVLSASLTLTTFKTNVEKTVIHEKTIFNTINQEQHDANNVVSLLHALEESSETFNINVIHYLSINRERWLREDSRKFGQELAIIALHIKEKLSFYKALKKSPMKKNKPAKEILLSLEKTSKAMQKNIQENIDYAYTYIDAKQSFSMLQKVSDVELDTFWFSEDEESAEKTLFVTSKRVSAENVDKVFELEDSLTEELQKIGEHKQKILADLDLEISKVDVFDFSAASKQHFTRVSFL